MLPEWSADLLVWLAYVLLLAFVISRHEPWFDEAQAWLLARDVGFGHLLTDSLRYEGTPGLWHSLLAIPAKSGLPYSSMKWLAGCIASAGVLVFLRAAPFSKWIRYLFPFSFFVFYQFAVVARSYVLLPLLLFSIAAVHRRAGERIWLLTALVALLANVSLHGFLLAGTLAACFALQTLRTWHGLDSGQRTRNVAAVGLLAAVAALIILQLRKPADLVGFGDLSFGAKHFVAVSALKLRDAFTASFLLSVPLLAVSAWWFYRRGTLLLFVSGVGALLALAAIAYSNVWHEGPIVLWWAFVMWIGWPEKPTRVPTAVTACWAVFLAVQLFWAARTSWFDVRFPYSGSKAIAEYIQSRHLYRHTIFAFDPKSTAILPYFQNDIFANWPKDHSYWLWSKSNKIEAGFSGISQVHPDYVVLAVTRDSDEQTESRRRSLQKDGYKLTRRFDGVLYWKAWILEGNFYELYSAPQVQSIASQ